MTNYTKAQEKALNDYLAVCIKNNYYCQHCANNNNGVCFFAFECFMDDMGHFDDDCTDISDDVDESNYDPYCGCDIYEIDEVW